MTASPIVLTTAPPSAATLSCSNAKMLAHHVEGGKVANPLIEFRRALEVGEQEGEAGDL